MFSDTKMNRFYVTLASNVSSIDYFLKNTVTNYMPKLPKKIRLDNSWKVGLVEISYTYSWLNLPAAESMELWYFKQYYSENDIGYIIEDEKIFEINEHVNAQKEKQLDIFIHVSKSKYGVVRRG